MRIDKLEPIFTEIITGELEEGKIYISLEYEVAVHLCACGCKGKTVTPLEPGEWSLTTNENKEVTLRPSIGNFAGEYPYHAHYYITNNQIQWL